MLTHKLDDSGNRSESVQLGVQSVDIDRELQDLALAAKSYAPGTLARRIASSELCCKMQEAGQFDGFGYVNLPPEAIDILDREVRQRAWYSICHRIDEYHLDYGSIVLWAKGIFIEEWERALERNGTIHYHHLSLVPLFLPVTYIPYPKLSHSQIRYPHNIS